MQSSGSPTTSETVRLRIRAGAMALARRPPLIADTCLRTVLTSTMDIPDASSSWCSLILSASGTPGGGRLASAELPPVNTHSARSCSPRSSACLSRARAPSALAWPGMGWSASDQRLPAASAPRRSAAPPRPRPTAAARASPPGPGRPPRWPCRPPARPAGRPPTGHSCGRPPSGSPRRARSTGAGRRRDSAPPARPRPDRAPWRAAPARRDRRGAHGSRREPLPEPFLPGHRQRGCRYRRPA